MAGEYDEKFDELTGLVKKVVGRVDELQLDMRDLRTEVQEMRSELRDNTSRLGSLENKVGGLSAQFTDVAGMVIRDHHPRIEILEGRMDVLESKSH